MTTPTTPPTSRLLRKTRGMLAATLIAAIATPAAVGGVVVDDESTTSSDQTSSAIGLLEAARSFLDSLTDLDVMVETSVVASDGRVTAPPKRSALAFSRQSKNRPLRFSVHSWSGPSGGSDLVCDGRSLLVGDPLLRRFDLRIAPPDVRTMLSDRDLSIRLGLGAAFLFSAMCEDTFADLSTADQATAIEVAGVKASVIECRSTDPESPRRLQLTVATEGDPILLGVRLPLADGNSIVMKFSDWLGDAEVDPHDGRPRFSMTPPPSWVKVASLTEATEAGEASAPVQALVGRRAPRIAMRDAEGNMVDPLTDMTVPVAMLFTADDALNDRAARDFATLTRSDDRFRGYRIQLASDELTLPRDDRDLVADIAGCGSSWRLSGLPTLVIITPDGRVRAAQVGHPGLSTWSARLTPLLDRLASVPDAE